LRPDNPDGKPIVLTLCPEEYMNEAHDPGLQRRKGRSPNYPGISLDVAIHRAGELYGAERQHPAPVSTVARHWKYKSFNGPASVTLAALKKFGLLEDEGGGPDRRARISDIGVEILANPDEQSRWAAIRDAALRPEIHLEMWQKYGSHLPSDATVQWELTRSRGFTETGAAEFLKEYKATLAFAQLEETPAAVTVQAADDDTSGAGDTPKSTYREESIAARSPGEPRQMSADSRRAFPIPLVSGGTVTVEGKFPLSERDWAQFMAVLVAMKPGLVASDPDDRASNRDAPER
jgi:hypothetical protein